MKKKVSKLDPALKAQWVEALRSGEYTQTTGNLKVVDAIDKTACHCCLGVLCEILDPNGFNNKTTEYGAVGHCFTGTKTVQDNYPNQMKMRQIGLYPSMYKQLALFNDDGCSFSFIADYIEKNL